MADDESNMRRMVGALLAGEGYEVTETPSGVEAVARVREGEPDVALVDLMMPGELDGMATLGRLREVAPDLPVIMMSGRAGLADAVKATKLGAFNFLEKPLTPEGVLLAVSSALELRQTRRVARALRAGTARDSVPGRGRRSWSRRPGEAAARNRGEGDPARRR